VEEVYNIIQLFLSLCIVSKGAKEWKWACLEFGLLECKLTTLVKMQFASKVTMFQQCLAYRSAIIMCYGHQIKVLAKHDSFNTNLGNC
jgi:hypothetical protein